jgi:hypothetical protein
LHGAAHQFAAWVAVFIIAGEKIQRRVTHDPLGVPFQTVRIIPVVGIQKGQPVTASHFCAMVARSRNAGIVLA